MKLNADFSELALVHTRDLDWKDSPLAGVQRKMLDRIGDEIARATSLVRYKPGSSFSSHTHTGGEEFFVIEGIFQDEHGEYPAGSYVRNPPESSHTPRSDHGCTIFVKLWQFDLSDRQHVNVNTSKKNFCVSTKSESIEQIVLHQDQREYVRIEKWQHDAEITLSDSGGIEILVLSGAFFDTHKKTNKQREKFTELSWLRIPADKRITLKCDTEGAIALVKSGHL